MNITSKTTCWSEHRLMTSSSEFGPLKNKYPVRCVPFCWISLITVSVTHTHTQLRHAKSDSRTLPFKNPGPWFTLALLPWTLMKVLVSHNMNGIPMNSSRLSKPISNPNSCSKKTRNICTKSHPQKKHNKKNIFACMVQGSFTFFISQLLSLCCWLWWISDPTSYWSSLNGQVILWSLNRFLHVPWITRVTWEN